MDAVNGVVEVAGTLFAMSVLAWVIYRLTWSLVQLVTREQPGTPPEQPRNTDADDDAGA